MSGQSAKAACEIAGVHQAFRAGFWLKRTPILHDLSFSVPEGAIFGFLGANGAGKTTLIHLIAGIKRPVSGSIRIFGHEATSIEARSRIGYLPERPYFHEHLTGDRLLKYFGALSGMKRGQVLDRIPQVLAMVGMTAARHVELRKYSKGMLQRMGIAQALLHDPPFLLLDEPMSGLDPLGRKEIRELIVGLAAEGRTILFSTHVIPDVEAICDQVALIRKGRLIGCGPIGSFLAKGPLQTEVTFSGIPLETAKAFPEVVSARQIPDAVKAIVSSQDSVQGLLDKLIARKAQVLWVTPIRPSLEDLFGETEARPMPLVEAES